MDVDGRVICLASFAKVQAAPDCRNGAGGGAGPAAGLGDGGAGGDPEAGLPATRHFAGRLLLYAGALRASASGRDAGHVSQRLARHHNLLSPLLRAWRPCKTPSLIAVARVVMARAGCVLRVWVKEGLMQVTMAELLQHWGEKGFEAHVCTMQREYAGRAAALQAAAQVFKPRCAATLVLGMTV